MYRKRYKMESSALKVSFSVDARKKLKMKKDALEFVNLLQEYMKDPKYKTELCKSYTDKEFCVYGNKCRFAHGKEELFQKAINHPKYKIKKCISFFQNSYCAYGSRCHFQHDERELTQTFRSYYSYALSLLALNTEIDVEKENVKFFDEEGNTVVPINRPISPIVKPSYKETVQEELIKEKLEIKPTKNKKRLAVFEQITEGKRMFISPFVEMNKMMPGWMKANCYYPMF
jgi:hypothetical protein